MKVWARNISIPIACILALLFSLAPLTLAAADTNCFWSEWTTTVHPTCTLPGQQYRVCTATAVSHRETQAIPALGHDYAAQTKAATCTEDGSRTLACRRCAHSYTEPFGKARGHSYKEEITLQPAPGKEGLSTFTCTYCDAKYTQPIPALATPVPEPDATPTPTPAATPTPAPAPHVHEFSVQTQTPPDCESDGHTTYVCAICAETYTETIPPLGHVYGEWTLGREPSLFVAGLRFKACAHDPQHRLAEPIHALFSLEVNTTDAVMAPINLILLLFFSLALLANFYVIFWDLRRRSKTQKAKKLKVRYLVLALLLMVLIFGLPLALLLFFRHTTYLNLLGFTAVSLIALTGLSLLLYSRRIRHILNGYRGVYEPGAQKGQLVTRNLSRRNRRHREQGIGDGE